MVTRDDHDRFVPITMGLDPVDNDFDRGLSAVNRANGVVEIVVVQGEIASFDEEGEGLAVLVGHCRRGQGTVDFVVVVNEVSDLLEVIDALNAQGRLTQVGHGN